MKQSLKTKPQGVDLRLVLKKTRTEWAVAGLCMLYVPFGHEMVQANLYSYVAGHPGATTDHVESLEDFMLMVATGIKGRKGDDYYFNGTTTSEDEDEEDERTKKKAKGLRAVYQTVRNSWNNFCGWCKRMGHPISPENKEYMTEVRLVFLLYISELLMVVSSTISVSFGQR